MGGGAGRAKGLGGPWAPALRRAEAEAEGEGGGRTTPVFPPPGPEVPPEVEDWECELSAVVFLLEGLGGVVEEGRGEVSLSASERSSGIWTLSCGRLAEDWLSTREGGGNSAEAAVVVRFGTGGGGEMVREEVVEWCVVSEDEGRGSVSCLTSDCFG